MSHLQQQQQRQQRQQQQHSRSSDKRSLLLMLVLILSVIQLLPISVIAQPSPSSTPTVTSTSAFPSASGSATSVTASASIPPSSALSSTSVPAPSLLPPPQSNWFMLQLLQGNATMQSTTTSIMSQVALVANSSKSRMAIAQSWPGVDRNTYVTVSRPIFNLATFTNLTLPLTPYTFIAIAAIDATAPDAYQAVLTAKQQAAGAEKFESLFLFHQPGYKNIVDKNVTIPSGAFTDGKGVLQPPAVSDSVLPNFPVTPFGGKGPSVPPPNSAGFVYPGLDPADETSLRLFNMAYNTTNNPQFFTVILNPDQGRILRDMVDASTFPPTKSSIGVLGLIISFVPLLADGTPSLNDNVNISGFTAWAWVVGGFGLAVLVLAASYSLYKRVVNRHLPFSERERLLIQDVARQLASHQRRLNRSRPPPTTDPKRFPEIVLTKDNLASVLDQRHQYSVVESKEKADDNVNDTHPLAATSTDTIDVVSHPETSATADTNNNNNSNEGDVVGSSDDDEDMDMDNEDAHRETEAEIAVAASATAAVAAHRQATTSHSFVDAGSTANNIVNNNGNAEPCSICLDDYAVGDTVRLLDCKHIFHTDCIDPYLSRTSAKCPLCRTDLRTSSEVEQYERNTQQATGEALAQAFNERITSASSEGVARFRGGNGGPLRVVVRDPATNRIMMQFVTNVFNRGDSTSNEQEQQQQQQQQQPLTYVERMRHSLANVINRRTNQPTNETNNSNPAEMETIVVNVSRSRARRRRTRRTAAEVATSNNPAPATFPPPA